MSIKDLRSRRIEAFQRHYLFQEYLYCFLEDLKKINPRIKYFDLLQPEETVFSGFMLPKTTVIKINKYLGSDRSDAISDFVTVIQLDDGIIFMRTVVLYNYMINQGPDFLKLTIMESINRFSGGLKGVLS